MVRFHTSGLKAALTSPVWAEMSASAPATIMEGRVSYSTQAASGALPARVAVSSLAAVSVPPPTSVCLTWMSGWALLNASTLDFWVVPQHQNSSVTCPLAAAGVLVLPGVPDEQAVEYGSHAEHRDRADKPRDTHSCLLPTKRTGFATEPT